MKMKPYQKESADSMQLVSCLFILIFALVFCECVYCIILFHLFVCFQREKTEKLCGFGDGESGRNWKRGKYDVNILYENISLKKQTTTSIPSLYKMETTEYQNL